MLRKTIRKARLLARTNKTEYVIICESGEWFTITYTFWLGSTYSDYTYRVDYNGIIWQD
jgi:hypothetical protein